MGKKTTVFTGLRTKIVIFCKNIKTKLLYLKEHKACCFSKFMTETKTSDNRHHIDQKPKFLKHFKITVFARTLNIFKPKKYDIFVDTPLIMLVDYVG